MAKIIGIDLGTTYSSLACLDDTTAIIIQDENGKRNTPSVVSFSSEEIRVGYEALQQGLDATLVRRIKRKMGTDYKKTATLWGLKEGQVVIMLHTGSEALGVYLGRLYSYRKKTDLKHQLLFFQKKI